MVCEERVKEIRAYYRAQSTQKKCFKLITSGGISKTICLDDSPLSFYRQFSKKKINFYLSYFPTYTLKNTKVMLAGAHCEKG